MANYVSIWAFVSFMNLSVWFSFFFLLLTVFATCWCSFTRSFILYSRLSGTGSCKAWSLSQGSRGMMQGTCWTGWQSITAHRYTTGHLEMPFRVICMALGCGRKPERRDSNPRPWRCEDSSMQTTMPPCCYAGFLKIFFLFPRMIIQSVSTWLKWWEQWSWRPD